jgi:hypothetical protein
MMIWLVLDSTGYPVGAFQSQALAEKDAADRPGCRVLRIFLQG